MIGPPAIAETTSNDLRYADPRLREVYPKITRDFEAQHPGWTVRVSTTTRSRGDQRIAYNAGHSEIDGTSKLGRHNAYPAQALDLQIVSRRSGRTLAQLLSSGQISQRVFDEMYSALGTAAESHGLTWGGRWKTLYDPYHVELSTAAPVTVMGWR